MRRPGGQATIELALGSIIFVGVLLIGIHMAEYAQLSLKVQDAQTFAVWEASGRRVQSRAINGATTVQPFGRTLDSSTGVGAAATQRFADFNGLDGTSNGDVVSRALTQGSGVSVRCEATDALVFLPSRSAARVMRPEGGLRCTASAEVRAINVPREFLQKDTGGFFRQTIVRRDPIPVCGMGLPVNGNCQGTLALLTNDWGLANEETEECKNDCDLSPYRGMIEQMFNGGGGAGAVFASTYAGPPPTDANEFQFSYSGVESGMIDNVGGEGIPTFITGGAGAGMVPRMSHPKCFLGEGVPVITWVAVAMVAAAPDAGPAPFSWDVPGQLQLVPVGKSLERDGLPMVVFLAKSSWEALDRLLLHYAARFAEAGYFIPPKLGRLPGLKLPRLAALDDVRMVSFLVYGWPEPDGSTTLVLGAADLQHRERGQGGALPAFPGAKAVTHFNLEMATALSFTAASSKDEVLDFYRSVLPSGGWKEREPGAFVRAGRVVRVLARKQATDLSVVVLEQSDEAPLDGTGVAPGTR